MKNNKKGTSIIPIIIIILLLIVIIIITVNVKKKSNVKKEENQNKQVTVQENTTQEEFVSKLEDGTKLNSSTKLNEEKTLEGMKISQIQITEKDGASQLLATVKNTTNKEQGNFPVALTILDKDGNTITVAHGYIKKLSAGEETQLSISKTFDFANAYDFTIAKE